MMYQRALVRQIKDRLAEDRGFIQIVVGPRQTGKTTALRQALEHATAPVHYASADDPLLVTQSWLSNEWDQARQLYQTTGKTVILAIDEVQKIPDWSAVVKMLWDEDAWHQREIKVVLTGSSSLLIRKGLSESLMGRFELLYCPHWSLTECRAAFNYALEDFLLFGGYPGSARIKDDETRWLRYMSESIVEPTITQDVLMMQEIRKPALLRALFLLGASHSGQELSYTKILGQLHDAGNTTTIAHYLDLLGKAGMLCGLEKFAGDQIQMKKSSPRMLAFDTSLMVYAEGGGRDRMLGIPEMRGHLIETAVGACLLARAQEEGFDLYWWRDRGFEVDFVLRKGRRITALEVKSGKIKDTKGSDEFLQRYPDALRLVVGSANYPVERFLEGDVELFLE
ncbi:MAG: ATP-binding protein [Coriobacteriia bacterium]|nr:ATP-binding protein [Coriobacteriia bacterium]